MKKIFFVLLSLSLSTHAAEVSSASYVVETGTMVVSGDPAFDLFEDLDAKVQIKGIDLNLRAKVKIAGKLNCTIEQELLHGIDGDIWTDTAATCQFHLPKSLIGPRYK